MNTSAEARRLLRGLGLEQAGVVSRERAEGHGVSSRVVARLVAEHHWRRLSPGIFLTADTDPTFEARAWAGVLLGGESARLGGLAAGRLHGLVDTDPDLVTVLVPHLTRLKPREGWEFVRERPGHRRVRTTGAPPRLGVEDTVLDLCASGSAADTVGWVTAAVQRRRTTPRQLRQALDARPRQRNRAVVLGLVEDVGQGAESPLEITFLRDVERAHGLPRSRRQAASADRRAVRDALYEEYGVVVELDGRLGHDELGRFRDMWRDNEATSDGLITLRYGASDLHGRPCEVAFQLADVLVRRGWAGLMTRCPSCRLVA